MNFQLFQLFRVNYFAKKIPMEAIEARKFKNLSSFWLEKIISRKDKIFLSKLRNFKPFNLIQRSNGLAKISIFLEQAFEAIKLRKFFFKLFFQPNWLAKT